MDKQKIIAQQNNITAVKQVREKVENTVLGYKQNSYSNSTTRFNSLKIPIGTDDFTIEYFGNFFGSNNQIDTTIYNSVQESSYLINCLKIYGADGYDNFINWVLFEGTADGDGLNLKYQHPDNSPFHFVVTRQGATIKAYVNGVLKGTKVQTSIKDFPNFQLGLANSSDCRFTRMYNYALSQSEVTQLYNNGKPEKYVLPSNFKDRTVYDASSMRIASNDSTFTTVTNKTDKLNGFTNTYFHACPNEVTSTGRYYISTYSRPRIIKKTSWVKIKFKYRSSIAFTYIYWGENWNKTLPANTGDAIEAEVYTKDSTAPFSIIVNPVTTLQTDWIEIQPISYEYCNCIAEYLPQNLLTSHDGQITDMIATKWLDSSKQLPLNDEYLPPLLNSIGGYDLTANGTPQIVYKSNNNQVVSKQNAVIGDLVVFDKYESQTKIVRGYTINKDELDPLYTPVGVIYKVDTDNNTLDVVSLDNIPNTRWAASYEVMLSGFDLTNGGTFILTIGGTNFTFTYTSGTISDISTQINSTLTSNRLNTTAKGGWVASVFNNSIILTSNTYSEQWATISVVSGITITYTADNKNYQTTLTGLLIDSNIEYVQRNNGVNSYFAGCNLAKFLRYYSVNGGTPTSNVPIGSTTIVNQTSFENSDFCIDLRAVYSNYANYLYGEHLLKYPPTYGAGLRDGKTNTSKIGTLTFTDIRGNISPCYPAAYIALNYGVSVSGITTGFEKNNWWLPSVKENFELMEKRAYSSATLSEDAVNTTLVRMAKATCYGNGYYPWTSCEYNFNGAFLFGGSSGDVYSSNKYYTYSVRSITKISIND